MDAEILYRVKRLPRQMFYVDVGKMPPKEAEAYLKKVRLELGGKPRKNVPLLSTLSRTFLGGLH